MSLKAKVKKYGHVFIGLFLACVAGLGVYYYIGAITPTQKILVAAMPIPVGTKITDDMVRFDVYPKSKISSDFIASPEEVIGKSVAVGLLENTPLRKGNLADAGKGGGLSMRLATVAPGREAFDLPVEVAPGLAGMVLGDQVDLYTEASIPDPTGKAVATDVRPVAKDAVVVSVPGQKTDKMTVPGEGKGSYVIAVKPEEAEQIAEGIVRGKKFSVFLLPPKGGR